VGPFAGISISKCMYLNTWQLVERRRAKWLSHVRRLSLSRSVLSLLLILAVASSSIAVYFLHPFTTTTFKHVREGGAAIVDALSELNPNPSFQEAATEYLNAAGMYVDVYKSSTVSVDFMKSFPAGYELIVFRVHSGTSRRARGVFYFTSELYDESKYQPEQFRGELLPAKGYEGDAQVFAFGSKFVDTYLEGRFQSAIIIGMGCFGAGISYGTGEEIVIEDLPVEKGSNLADAFHRQGASAVIGWDRLVSLNFSDQATLWLIRALAVNRLTVSEAVYATNRQLGPDPIYKSVLTFNPEDGGSHVLRLRTSRENPPRSSEWLIPDLAELLRRPFVTHKGTDLNKRFGAGGER